MRLSEYFVLVNGSIQNTTNHDKLVLSLINAKPSLDPLKVKFAILQERFLFYEKNPAIHPCF